MEYGGSIWSLDPDGSAWIVEGNTVEEVLEKLGSMTAQVRPHQEVITPAGDLSD